MYKFKIDKIVVNTTDGPTDIVPKKINVLVGPNNSGKSRFLKELRDYISGDDHDLKIINNIDFALPDDFSELDQSYNVMSKMFLDQFGNWFLKTYSYKPIQGLDMSSSLDYYFTRNSNSFTKGWKESFSNMLNENNYMQFLRDFGSLFYQYIGTEERLMICKTQKSYGLDNNSTNYLSSVRFNVDLLNDLSYKVKQLFKKDIYLDSQTLGDRIAFRVGNDFSEFKINGELSQNDANNLYKVDLLDNQGDGLKSFVSTFLSLNSKEGDLILLDEPEAFLHPPLARQLGEMIGSIDNDDTTVFVATHSVEILKGILSKNQNVNVIRITRADEKENDIRVLDQEVLENILHNPLLRVSRVLEGVFCDKVIITESEADELVYQELTEKFAPESGMYFVHGQNKQTLSTIANLYKKIGIKYEIIVDFDVLRVSSEFKRFLELMEFDERDMQQIINYADKFRKDVEAEVVQNGLTESEYKDEIKKKKDEVYHKKGIRYKDKYKSQIRATFDLLSEHHLHILETGELETILEDFKVGYKEKRLWIVEAIQKISEISKDDIKKDSALYRIINGIINS